MIATATAVYDDFNLLEALSVCPVHQEGRFRSTWLPGTVLLVCEAGCRGRRIAVALGLDGWPEARP